MSDKFIRFYQPMEVEHIKPHLLVYGDLGGACENCKAMDIKLDLESCPKCGTAFHFISFRNIKSHIPKIKKLFVERPNISIVDFDDYKMAMGASKAKNIFGD